MDFLRRNNGRVRGGVADGRPALTRDIHLAEAILALSGHHQRRGRRRRAGRRSRSAPASRLADLAEERAGDQISFADTQVQPRAVITSPEWSGSETGGRRYSPFVVNVERQQAVAHADRPDALLPRPRVDRTSTARRCRSTGHRWTTLRHYGDQGVR